MNVRVRRNKNLLDEVKKHSRTSPEVQFKEMNGKHRSTSRSIEQCQPKHKQKYTKKLRNQNNQTNKTKIYSLLKLMKFLSIRQNLMPLIIPISKKKSKPIFVYGIGPV